MYYLLLHFVANDTDLTLHLQIVMVLEFAHLQTIALEHRPIYFDSLDWRSINILYIDDNIVMSVSKTFHFFYFSPYFNLNKNSLKSNILDINNPNENVNTDNMTGGNQPAKVDTQT